MTGFSVDSDQWKEFLSLWSRYTKEKKVATVEDSSVPPAVDEAPNGPQAPIAAGINDDQSPDKQKPELGARPARKRSSLSSSVASIGESINASVNSMTLAMRENRDVQASQHREMMQLFAAVLTQNSAPPVPASNSHLQSVRAQIPSLSFTYPPAEVQTIDSTHTIDPDTDFDFFATNPPMGNVDGHLHRISQSNNTESVDESTAEQDDFMAPAAKRAKLVENDPKSNIRPSRSAAPGRGDFKKC